MRKVLRSFFGMSLLAIGALALGSGAIAQQQAAPETAKPKPKPKPKTKQQQTQATETAVPAVGGAQPTLLGTYGDWGAYTASPGGKKICFALAKPAKMETQPANRPRDAAYLFISTRPTEKVKDEVSVIFGYGFKPNSDASIETGGTTYAMYTQNDGAWIKNAAEEARLVEAMRKGEGVIVKGVSARGTATTDTYSLKGLAQALDKVTEACQ